MSVDPEEFRASWPQVVRALAVATRSLDLGEEYAAEAFARAAAQPDGSIDDLAAWCVQVGRRAWTDQLRRDAVAARWAPDLAHDEIDTAAMEPSSAHDVLDDRLALLFVACDDALASGAQMVLALRVVCGLSVAQIAEHLGIADATAAARLTRAKATLERVRGAFVVPAGPERDRRLPVVLACVAAVLTVGMRESVDPDDATTDLARDALTLAETLAAAYPDDPEVLGLRAVCRLALARRPGRVRDGIAVPLDEAIRSTWDRRLLRLGLNDASAAMEGSAMPGRFTLEAAISGLHASSDQTDWERLAQLYEALLGIWASPAVRVGRLVVESRRLLGIGGDLAPVERELEELVADGPAYAARDAGLALADLAWRTGRRDDAAARYRELAEVVPEGPLRAFCLSRT